MEVSLLLKILHEMSQTLLFIIHRHSNEHILGNGDSLMESK